MSDPTRICLVSGSGQNVFFAEILEAFGAALREQGLVVEESVDCFPPPAEDLVCLFIPHEYDALVHELARPTPAQLRRSVAICTEQPGTDWFELSCALAAQAGAVVDINALGAAEMKRRGVVAEHARLGHVPAWDVWHGQEGGERSIDVAFLGRYTPERAYTIARCVPALARRRAAIYLTETVKPHVSGSTYFLAADRRGHLLADSKLLLNVHQQDLPYLEWHRVLSAVLNGCVVLTEHSLGTHPLEPGTHFVSARRKDLPLVLEALLDDPARLAAIRQAAYDAVREEMPMSAATEVVLDAVHRAHRVPAAVSGPPAPPPAPMPQELSERKPGWEAYAEQVGEQLPVRRALMDIVARTRRLERRIEELASNGEGDRVDVQELGPDLERPQVSVLLTVYNHADLVDEAVRSVALSEIDGVELVAVDDGSTDGSAEAVRAACADAPWLTTRLVRCSLNSGLPAAARNVAAEHARADLLFVLDADNSVLPQGLAKLATALEKDREAAFAYGIIQRFDVTGHLDLMSWLDWDPERMRHGNYVDAMAMIRRSALASVGGYPTQQPLAGWEDFALWLAMADAGMRGVRVPDFIGRYRVSQHSMLSIAGIDHSEAWTTIMRKYPATLLAQG